ncbi:MAG: hypothetical protein ACYCO3_13255, partial [Mycobacteriales bacterium]
MTGGAPSAQSAQGAGGLSLPPPAAAGQPASSGVAANPNGGITAATTNPNGAIGSGSGLAPAGSVTSETPVATRSGSSATADHAPIQVGFMYSINDAAASAGVNNNNTITLGNVVHALVN